MFDALPVKDPELSHIFPIDRLRAHRRLRTHRSNTQKLQKRYLCLIVTHCFKAAIK